MAVWIDFKAMSRLIAARIQNVTGVTLLFPQEDIPEGIATVTARFMGFGAIDDARERREASEPDVVEFSAAIEVWSPVQQTKDDGWELETALSKLRIALLTTISDSSGTNHRFVGKRCSIEQQLDRAPDEDRRAVLTITGTCTRRTGETLE